MIWDWHPVASKCGDADAVIMRSSAFPVAVYEARAGICGAHEERPALVVRRVSCSTAPFRGLRSAFQSPRFCTRVAPALALRCLSGLGCKQRPCTRFDRTSPVMGFEESPPLQILPHIAGLVLQTPSKRSARLPPEATSAGSAVPSIYVPAGEM